MKRCAWKFPRAAAVGLAVFVGAFALTGRSAAKAGDEPTAVHVLSQMHHINQMEMDMGRMAMERGHSKAVRNFGKRLQRDHQANDKKVMELAQRERVTLEMGPPQTPEEQEHAAEEAKTQQDLQAAQGADFDRAFLQAMERGHADAAAMLTQAHDQIHDEDVRHLVAATIPTVEKHRKMAQDAESKL